MIDEWHGLARSSRRLERVAHTDFVVLLARYVTQHVSSDIGKSIPSILGNHYCNASGQYFTRSPIMYDHGIGNPTLNIFGPFPGRDALPRAVFGSGVEFSLSAGRLATTALETELRT